MKITKEYLRNLILETLEEADAIGLQLPAFSKKGDDVLDDMPSGGVEITKSNVDDDDVTPQEFATSVLDLLMNLTPDSPKMEMEFERIYNMAKKIEGSGDSEEASEDNGE